MISIFCQFFSENPRFYPKTHPNMLQGVYTILLLDVSTALECVLCHDSILTFPVFKLFTVLLEWNGQWRSAWNLEILRNGGNFRIISVLLDWNNEWTSPLSILEHNKGYILPTFYLQLLYFFWIYKFCQKTD